MLKLLLAPVSFMEAAQGSQCMQAMGKRLRTYAVPHHKRAPRPLAHASKLLATCLVNQARRVVICA